MDLWLLKMPEATIKVTVKNNKPRYLTEYLDGILWLTKLD